MQPFATVSDQIDFSQQEESTLEFWNKIDAFETSLKKSEGLPRYTFYDGPPFATGLPHYGHILAGTIKDIVTRYAHQTGHHVERRFGWDCHGLPIEFEIEKQLGIKTKQEVLELGIDKYNEACRSIVMRYSSEWEKTVTRLGRWIDFKNDYKTMNPSFMESVWWVFSQLWEKNLVYRGFKVMPYSTACTTPLSNFEANMNYQNVSDPEVTVKFKSLTEENTYYLGWTTTPWTLPSNLALCVHPDFEYVHVLDKPSQSTFVMAKSRVSFVYSKKEKDNFQILKTSKGTDLVGNKYEPLFDYFENEFLPRGAFQIVADTYVTDDSGTGVVHNAPGFGEDDYRVCLAHGIIGKDTNVPCPIDENGNFLPPVGKPFVGKYIKDMDKEILAHLKAQGKVHKSGSFFHNYPFCWRSDTPLIYRAVPSWFVRVEEIKQQLLENNKKTYWVPDSVKEGRFHNWLENAQDWAISRSRYWGTPIPVWTNEDFSEFVVMDSIEKLQKLSGRTITDLHRENIDDIEIPAPSGNGVLRRIPDVFDCWFESGSMPYAQIHYPFEMSEKEFSERFPADFIAEGVDQTRGWFYTLMVLGTALFNEPPFKNLIVNGIVLASDGRKMSKRLKNYPDPVTVIDKYGADALRLYLINSPVVHAEPFKFQEEGVEDIVKVVFTPWFNAYRLFTQNANAFARANGGLFSSDEAHDNRPENLMDRWILSLTQSLILFVQEEMKGYRLYTVIPKLVSFIDQFTNWYLRLNRPRLKGDTLKGPNALSDWKCALMTTYQVLVSLARLMAPFTPFLTEHMYQNLKNIIPREKREDSIHFLMMPEYESDRVDKDIELGIQRMQSVVVAARELRSKQNISIKIPVRSVTVCTTNTDMLQDIERFSDYIKLEVNCKDVICESQVTNFFQFSASAKNRELGRRLKGKLRVVSKAIQAFTHDDVLKVMKSKTVEVEGEEISLDDMNIHRTFTGDQNRYVATDVEENLVVLDHVLDDSLRQEGAFRDISSSIMQLRKESRLVPEDETDVYLVFKSDDDLLKKQCEARRELLDANLPNMKLQFRSSFDGIEWFALKDHQVPSICGEYNPIQIAFGGPTELKLKSLKRQSDYFKKLTNKFRDELMETKKKLRDTKEKLLTTTSLLDDSNKQVTSLTAEKEKLILKLKALQA